ncbi:MULTISPECIES: SMI1/KNR4 family protein [Actinomadura]|uniref:SMI1/KNR4 family protein n=1 Tax=Actinomadura TaxID=1988 RepID=UPI0004007777|nr:MULTISPECIES: SMI1/KNR4 family protein [Actinomadura]RSN62136.1 hypothetical protein DMH08_19800 [Actinomadura sp. WAC 06369]
MDSEELLATVYGLLEAETGDLTCDQPGHRDGHTCVLVTDGGILVPDDRLTERYSRVYWRDAEPPMALPEGCDWDSAWARGRRAVAVGQDADDRIVVAVARRTVPEFVEPPAELPWPERLHALTGGPPEPVPAPDWAAVEGRLGAPLPGDYKRLVELFGCKGAFNGFYVVFPPDKLIWHTEYGLELGGEHPPFPAPGGLIPWSNNEHEQTFCWITEGDDPDRWPVYAVDSLDEGTRFDCTAAEFLYRAMTEEGHPFHLAAEGPRGHWFKASPPSKP